MKRSTATGRTAIRGISDFAGRLFQSWRSLKLPTSKTHVILAVSGGADSTALLMALDELARANKLSLSLTIAHLDHSLRKTSREDASWVEKLAIELGHEFVKRRTDIKKRATRSGDNLEQAARRARYEFLKRTAQENHSMLVVTAHTLDDQAETILLRLLRGSAAEGLSGIEPVRLIEPKSPIQLVRPLLSWARRIETEDYCRLRKVEFRIDEMNQDEKYSRVRVRKQLLPLMHSFNSKIVEALSRTATLLREDAGALSDEASKLLRLASGETLNLKSAETLRERWDNPARLSVEVLASAPAAVRRRALRQWISQGRGDLRRLEMVHLVAVDRLIEGNRGGRIAELPDGGKVVRKRGWLELDARFNGKKRLKNDV
ncbi:MAG: tRNA lysidine(34) synthetase TilS [Pyrinomonadaceae bacterium]|nr:tRNA lysidine(34) synthetase TilS [Pyrinomonadaceae bacterium]